MYHVILLSCLSFDYFSCLSFETLRVLKPEIEHIRKLLEKSRVMMQSQFDQWFNSLHQRDGVISKSNPHTSIHGELERAVRSEAKDKAESFSRGEGACLSLIMCLSFTHYVLPQEEEEERAGHRRRPKTTAPGQAWRVAPSTMVTRR